MERAREGRAWLVKEERAKEEPAKALERVLVEKDLLEREGEALDQEGHHRPADRSRRTLQLPRMNQRHRPTVLPKVPQLLLPLPWMLAVVPMHPLPPSLQRRLRRGRL